jgi:hypothetical protein
MTGSSWQLSRVQADCLLSPVTRRNLLISRRSTRARHDLAVDWSWVETLEEVAERREHARRLVGLRLAAVRYVNLDYTLPDRPDGLRGARTVTSELEWREPAWRYEFGDSVDWGIEFETGLRAILHCHVGGSAKGSSTRA